MTTSSVREAERRLCSCGIGYETWAVQHAAKCPAAGLLVEATRRAATEPAQPVVARLKVALEDLLYNGYQPSYNGRPSCPFCLNFIDSEETHSTTCELVAALLGDAR